MSQPDIDSRDRILPNQNTPNRTQRGAFQDSGGLFHKDPDLYAQPGIPSLSHLRDHSEQGCTLPNQTRQNQTPRGAFQDSDSLFHKDPDLTPLTTSRSLPNMPDCSMQDDLQPDAPWPEETQRSRRSTLPLKDERNRTRKSAFQEAGGLFHKDPDKRTSRLTSSLSTLLLCFKGVNRSGQGTHGETLKRSHRKTKWKEKDTPKARKM